MLKLLASVAMASAFFHGAAAQDEYQQFWSGQLLYEYCTSADVRVLSYCNGYVAGVVDYLNARHLIGETDCTIQAGTTTAQLGALAASYVARHAEARLWGGAAVVLAAISEASLCR